MMSRHLLVALACAAVLVACSDADTPSPQPSAPSATQPEPKPLATPTPEPAPVDDESVDDERDPVAVVVTEVEEVSQFEEVSESDIKESAFDSRQWNSAIGLGGGAGGRAGEEYAPIDEHGFLIARDHPLSTFGIDVDGASWSNTRRFLEDSELPPKDAVRVEEFVNWFGYDDAVRALEGDHPIAVHAEAGACPWRPEHELLRVTMRTETVDPDTLPPCNLVFLVDASGSMRSRQKLPLLKRALRLMVDYLRDEDRIAVVTYASNARVVLEPTSGSERATIRAAIDGLSAGGSTHGEGGIRVAYDLATQHARDGVQSRVILATDGDFNVGIRSHQELVGFIEEKRDTGVFLSVLGFGTGNLKEARLEALGRRGNGSYSYIDSIAEARRVLVDQRAAALSTVAKDVKIQIEFNPAFVAGYRQIGYENRKLAPQDFNDDKKDAGEIGSGHFVTALYEIVPAGTPVPGFDIDPLRYAQRGSEAPSSDAAEPIPELLHVKVRYKLPDASTSRRFDVALAAEHAVADSSDFRFASAVAAFGLALAGSDHLADFGFADVLQLARGAVEETNRHRAEREEFLKLVQMAADLSDS